MFDIALDISHGEPDAPARGRPEASPRASAANSAQSPTAVSLNTHTPAGSILNNSNGKEPEAARTPMTPSFATPASPFPEGADSPYLHLPSPVSVTNSPAAMMFQPGQSSPSFPFSSQDSVVQPSPRSPSSVAPEPPEPKLAGRKNKLKTSSLLECLNRFTKIESLSNNFKCAGCQELVEATKQLSIAKLPPVLCFQLKRFRQGTLNKKSSKITTYVSFPTEELDMTPYIENANQGSLEQVYDLYAVVCHKGQLDNGHYICYIKSNQIWFECDDTYVQTVTTDKVSSSNAYLLFYIRRHAQVYSGLQDAQRPHSKKHKHDKLSKET